jgi:hypothetical protein
MAACNISTIPAYKAVFNELGIVALCDSGLDVGAEGSTKLSDVIAKLKKMLAA